MKGKIPFLEINAEGGPAGNQKGTYDFYAKDGKIPLPQGAKAYILAFPESEEAMAYSLSSFTINRQQQVAVELHEASKQEFIQAQSVFDEQGCV